MARGRRPSTGEPRQLDKDVFFGFVRRVKGLKQEVSDANMAHAGQWQKAEGLGIHLQAGKLFVRLDDMEATKRSAFLRAFDEMRRWSDWDSQADLFEAAAEAGPDPQDVPLEERPLVGDDERAPQGEADPSIAEVEAEGAEDGEQEAEATEELAGAGFIFAEGKQAGMAGQSPDANPNPEGSAAYRAWANGHAQGVRDAETPEEEPAAAPAPARGRRARQAEVAAVH